ncbi:MAG: LPS assembly protein LptD [Wenzhouxiangellaceae bacterium]|nr:LPS assembly protein LptD [Wenzhouxiangellaceae bacterium]
MNRFCRCRYLLPLLMALPLAAAAQLQTGSQAPAESCQAPGSVPERGTLDRGFGLPVRINADDMQTPGRNQPIRLSGNVELAQGDQRLRTDEMIYDRDSGQVRLPGWLEYSDAVVAIEAASADYNTRSSSGQFEQVRYFIAGAAGAGHAETLRMVNETEGRVQVFDFTTCDIDDPDWQLKAGRVKLDFERNVGTARNARLNFKGVPILYLPWLSFPLNDDRKTGFLYPQLGSSSDNGLDLAAPFYWNIAPNMDATLTPRLVGDRGVMLGSEYRFLTRRQGGTFNFDYLPDDDELDRDRWLGRIRHGARLFGSWSSRLNFNRVSDEDYFLDLGNELESSAIQFLRSDFSVLGRGRNWNASATFDTFQVLDRDVRPANEPYDRLPRIVFDGDWPLAGGLAVRLASEAVYFDRDLGVTGARLDATPEIAWRVVRPWGFFEPALGLRTTAWSLQDQETATDDTPTRVQPIASLDGGLVFERGAGDDYIQTLEPRLFYLYVPGREQDELPVFDARELTFGFGQLFATNRFSSADRQSDANQLSLAVTTRLIRNEDGRSLVDASVGQILFLDDASVGLRPNDQDSRDVSATIGEVNWNPSERFRVSAGLQWDFEDNETDVAAFGLSWKGQTQRQVQLGYRFRRDRVDQVDVRTRLPLTHKLNLIGRLGHSFEDSTTLEALGGIEYESCCWSLRASVRNFVNDRESGKRTAFYLELHLKGLGSLGRSPYNLFTR